MLFEVPGQIVVSVIATCNRFQVYAHSVVINAQVFNSCAMLKTLEERFSRCISCNRKRTVPMHFYADGFLLQHWGQNLF